MPKEASQHASGDVSGEGTTKGGKMPGSSVEWAEGAEGCRRGKDRAQTCFLTITKWRASSSPGSHTTVLCLSTTQNQWTNHRGLKSILSSLSCLCQVFVTMMKSLIYYMWILWDSGFCCHFHIGIQHPLIIHRSHYFLVSPLSPTTL